MRIRRLDLSRYGKFTDRAIDFGERVDGQPDLHIVYGPNEAGKSTAFSGFLDLLFGIEVQSRYGFLHPYPTMRVGGCLELSIGPRELIRTKRRQGSLLDAANEPVPDSLILGDLGGLDRSSYRTMFSLDDETLEAGGKSILASNGELGQLLFSASAGLAELSRTLTGIRTDAEVFAKAHARGGELQQLKADLAALKQEREAIDTLASEYGRLAAARDEATKQYRGALAERGPVELALTQVRNMLTALPRLAALRDLQVRLEPLEDTPNAPAGWAAELMALQEADIGHRSETGLADADVKRLSVELAEVVTDDPALRLAGRLDRLAELRARYLTADLDLPTRRGELTGTTNELATLLQRLGRADEENPARLLLDAAQTAALDELMASRSGIEAKLEFARDEQSGASEKLSEAERVYHASGDSGHVRSLVSVASALSALRDSDHLTRLRAAARARTEHTETLKIRLAALAPWAGTVEGLAALLVPEAAEVQAWKADAERDSISVESRRSDLDQAQTELDRRQAELDAIGQVAGLLGDAEAAVVRREREAAWSVHRRALDLATADAFEAVLRRDDTVGEVRLANRSDLAKLHETALAHAARRSDLNRARKLLDEALELGRCHAERAVRASAIICQDPTTDFSPSWLLGWLSRRKEVLESGELLRQAEHDVAEAEADAATFRNRLLNALSEAEVPCDVSAGVASIVAAAQTALDGETESRTLRQTVADCERDLKKREQAYQRAVLLDQKWNAAWRAACSACWLGETADSWPVAVAREMLKAASELGPVLNTRAGLAERVRSMEADQFLFRSELEGLVQGLDIKMQDQDPLELAQIVSDRVDAATRADESRRRLLDALEKANDRQRQAANDSQAHSARISEMSAVMGAASLIELGEKLRDAELKNELERQAAQAEQDIRSTLRVGTMAEAVHVLDAEDRSQLEPREKILLAELEDLQRRTEQLYAAKTQAEDRISAVGGDDAAARIEERRRTKRLEIEEKAGLWLRLRAGIAAAEKALRAYRDKHRSSMMVHASEAFRTISRDAYSGLSTQPDRDGDILVAIGADGGSKLATDLSKGTRFQLYLALRAAGYHEFARQRPPVPFIADDIMETFDDLRAEETLRVFAGMAQLGQVIYLTHHDHLRVMAERIVPGVRVHEMTT